MALILTGRKDVDFPSKDGGRIQGVQLHCIQEVPTVQGQLTEVLFISITKSCHSSALSLPFGSVITPIYNKYGKVDDYFLKELPGGLGPDGKPLPDAPGKPGK